MQKPIKVFLYLLGMAMFWGCQQKLQEAPIPQTSKLIVVKPYAHLTFDKEPSEEELQQALQRIDSELASQRTTGAIPVGGSVPLVGEKKVVLKSRTGGRRHAETDDNVDFFAYYDSYTIQFDMDDPNKDDRERNAIDYFVYVFPAPHDLEWDRLDRVEIRNFGTDGWYCLYVEMTERNWKDFNGEAPDAGYVNTRQEIFIFNGWVETDRHVDRIARPSVNGALMQLRPIGSTNP